MTGHLPRRPLVSTTRVWLGLLGGPMVWAVQELLGYAFVPLACQGSRFALYLLDGAVFLAALAALFTAVGTWRIARGNETRDGQAIAFMGLSGIIVGIMFLAVIVMFAAPHPFLEACHIR